MASVLATLQATARRYRERRLKGSFKAFARELWPVYVPTTPKPVWCWFHDAICDEIEALFTEADRRRAIVERISREIRDPTAAGFRIQQAINGHSRDEPVEPLTLVVEVGPRTSKSSIVQRALPAWRWQTRPQEQFLTLSCVGKLVERDGIYLRDLVGSPEYKALVHDEWELRQDQNAKSKFDTTRGGTRQGYGIDTSYTGVDADVRVIDDPHDLEDFMNRPPESIINAADEVVRTYRDKIEDRANNRLFVITIVIMQRVAENDLAAYLLSKGARSVCLPTLFDPDHPRRYPKDPRTTPDEPLDPIRKPKAEMVALRKESEWWFEAKEQQNPSAHTGGGLTRENFRIRYTADPVALAATCDEVWISSDAAQKGADANDYHAIQVYGRKGGLRYVLDRLTDKMTPTVYDQTMDGLVEKWSIICQRAKIPLNVLVEDTANGAHWLETRRGRFVKAHLFAFSPNLVPGKDKSKAARWHYFVRDATAEQIILPASAPWVEDLLRWWCAGLRAAHDDDADAASQLSVWLEVSEQDIPAVDAFAWMDSA